MTPEDVLVQWKRTLNNVPCVQQQKPKSISLQAMTSLLKSADSHLTSLEQQQLPQDLKKQKDSLESILSFFTNERCDLLRHKIVNRKRKRLRQKLAKKEREEIIKKKDEACSRWVEEKRKQELRSRLEKSVELTTAGSLAAVEKKRQDMKYYTEMLQCLRDLRELRRSKRDRGNLPPIREDEKFSKTCSALDSILVKYTEVYKEEDDALRTMMSKQVDDEMTVNKRKHTTSVSEMSVEEYYTTNDPVIIEERRSVWDSYISSDGSPVPFTWVEPVLPSNEMWNHYLDKIND